MDLHTLLNTRLTVGADTQLPFAMQHAMPHELQQQHFGAPAYMNGGRIKSETGSERGVSPHPSETSRYPSQQPQQMASYPPMPAQHMNQMRYPSPTHMQQPIPLLNQQNYIPPPDHTYAQQAPPDQSNQQPGGRPANENGPPKAFACSTCHKGFARRSDLARHGKELGPREHT